MSVRAGHIRRAALAIEDADRRLPSKVGASDQPLHAVLDAEGRQLARDASAKPSSWEAMLELLEPAPPAA